jgi:hypothetical protein
MTWSHNITKWYDQSRNKKICKRCWWALEAHLKKWENFSHVTFLCCTSHHCNSNHHCIIELQWFFQIWRFKILKAIHQTLFWGYTINVSLAWTKYGFSSNNTPMALTLDCYIHSFFLLVKNNYEKKSMLESIQR